MNDNILIPTSVCQRHKNVETHLFCSRCKVAICPNCMKASPTGYRCQDCGKKRNLPTYVVSRKVLGKALLISVGAGLTMGFLLYILYEVLRNYPTQGVISFYLFLGGIVISGLLIGETISLSVNRKKGWTLRFSVIVAIFISVLTLILVGGFGIVWIVNVHILLALLVGYILGASRV